MATLSNIEIKEIISIALSNLTNGNHIEFNKQSYQIITGQTAVAEEFAELIAQWHAAIVEEDRVMEKITFSELTKRIADADKDRDTLYDMFMRVVRAYLGFTEAPQREAAEKIVRYDRANKVETQQQYDRETGNMSNFIQDMHQYCTPEVEMLSLAPVLSQMEEKNQLVSQLLLERNEQYVDNKHIAVKEARRVTDDRYELVRKFINASALLKGISPYERTIELMNQNIERTKQQALKQTGQPGVDGGATGEGAGGSEGEGSGSGSGSTGSGSGSTGSGSGSTGSDSGSESEEKYRVTYKYNDGTEEDQEYNAGDTITPPANTPNYVWKNLPSTMPAQNITVTEEWDINQPPPSSGGGESGFD